MAFNAVFRRSAFGSAYPNKTFLTRFASIVQLYAVCISSFKTNYIHLYHTRKHIAYMYNTHSFSRVRLLQLYALHVVYYMLLPMHKLYIRLRGGVKKAHLFVVDNRSICAHSPCRRVSKKKKKNNNINPLQNILACMCVSVHVYLRNVRCG